MPQTAFAVLSEIGSIPFDDGSQIKFSLDSYKGHKYISIRKYLKSDTYSGPTKSGITLSFEMVDKIAQALNALPADINVVEDKELGKYAKRQGLAVVLRISSYMGARALDLRQWQEDEAYTGWTKKGIRLPLEKLGEVKNLFAKTLDFIKEQK